MLTKESISQKSFSPVSSSGDGCWIWVPWLRFNPLVLLRRYWVFNFMGHFLSAAILVPFIMLFIGALMMFYALHVWVHVCLLTRLCTTLMRNASVCLSSVYRGVCPWPLRVSRYMPMWTRMGGTGLLQWWVHLTPKPAFSHKAHLSLNSFHSQLVHKN